MVDLASWPADAVIMQRWLMLAALLAGATCGHYTQVVWRATQQVGCALGRCPGLAYPNTIVCDYGPGGNVNNQKPY